MADQSLITLDAQAPFSEMKLLSQEIKILRSDPVVVTFPENNRHTSAHIEALLEGRRVVVTGPK